MTPPFDPNDIDTYREHQLWAYRLRLEMKEQIEADPDSRDVSKHIGNIHLRIQFYEYDGVPPRQFERRQTKIQLNKIKP